MDLLRNSRGGRFFATALLAAGLATCIFWLLTFRSGYPFVVDDFVFLAASYRPDFGLHDFVYMLPRRPLATLINFASFKIHLFERTQFPFFAYFFVHSLGVIYIARYALERWGGVLPRSVVWCVSVFVLICVYPNWYEINLMALDLPHG